MNRQIKPITPDDALQEQMNRIPDFVVETVNSLIVEKLSRTGHCAIIHQNAIIEDLQEKHNCTREEVFDRHWLDFEEIYEKAGWDVNYDEGIFKFSKKKQA